MDQLLKLADLDVAGDLGTSKSKANAVLLEATSRGDSPFDIVVHRRAGIRRSSRRGDSDFSDPAERRSAPAAPTITFTAQPAGSGEVAVTVVRETNAPKTAHRPSQQSMSGADVFVASLG